MPQPGLILPAAGGDGSNVVEKLRQIVRKTIGANSSLYRVGSTVLDAAAIVRSNGLRTWWMLRNLKKRKDPLSSTYASLALDGLLHPILVRPGIADVTTIVDSICREEYGQFAPSLEPQWVIDAGAYIGDTSAYFLSRFRQARVIALEPNPPSHEMASRNLSPYGARVTLLNMGLSAADGTVRFGGADTGASIQDDGFEVTCTSIPSLLRRYSIPRVDVLKMDIEGGEKLIFASNPEAWLKRVDLLIIEIHDEESEALIRDVLHKNMFTMTRYRSVWYCSCSA